MSMAGAHDMAGARTGASATRQRCQKGGAAGAVATAGDGTEASTRSLARFNAASDSGIFCFPISCRLRAITIRSANSSGISPRASLSPVSLPGVSNIS